ncbi:hypothetical protein D3C85_1327170 [compost metagenome]
MSVVGRGCGVDQIQQFPCFAGFTQLRERHARPNGSVRVLTSVLAHARQVALDVARVQAARVKRWVKQQHGADVRFDQMLIQ